MDGFLLKLDHKTFSNGAKALIKIVEGKTWIKKEFNKTWRIFYYEISQILHPDWLIKEENILPSWQHVI